MFSKHLLERMSEFVSEGVYSVTSWDTLNSWFPEFFYSFIFSIYWAPIMYQVRCSCWGYDGEQNWTWFCLPGIHRPDRNRLVFILVRDEAAYFLQFHHVILLSDTYLLPSQSIFHLLSLSSNDHHSFHVPNSSTVPGSRKALKHVYQGLACTSQPRPPVRVGLTL